MSTTARKARKRARIKFQHPTKIGTPRAARGVPFDGFTWRNRWGLAWAPAWQKFVS
jgi:hypothetical protein